MPPKKTRPVTFSPSDSRYDKPFRYLREHRAYVTTLQTKTKRHLGFYDVTPDGGDRAVPKGIVEAGEDGAFRAYLYHPAYSAELSKVQLIGKHRTLDEAIASILRLDRISTE